MSAVTARLASLLDSTLSGVKDKLVMSEDCQECKAAGGWCLPCLELETQSEALGLAVTEVQRCGDDEAKRVFMGVMAMLAGVTRYGIASGTVKTVTA